MEREQKIMLGRIIVTAVLVVIVTLIPVTGWAKLGLYLIPYLIISYDVLAEAFEGLKDRDPLAEDFLMAVASIGALALAHYRGSDYIEGIAVMLFFQLGELFEDFAVDKSEKNIRDLMDIRPDSANLLREDGSVETVDPDTVEVGTLIVVRPGEKIPIDGTVTDGASSIDTAALTGESIPRDVCAGDEVISGTLNQTGVLTVRTTKLFGESTASKILTMIKDSGDKKSQSETFIRKFARVYTPAVVGAALAMAVIPGVILLIAGHEPRWATWIYRALTFLVVSCPCALVMSIPLTFFAGLGGASREGILVKGSHFMEVLSNVRTMVFDKTGTLTKGVFEVAAVHPKEIDQNELLHLAAHVERNSTHPIANSLRNAYPDEQDDCAVGEAHEIPGRGMQAVVNGKTVAVGNSKLMDDVGAAWHECSTHEGTVIHVAVDGEYAGHIVISDVIKDHSKQAVSALRKAGVARTVMLTGDQESVAANVAGLLGIDQYSSELLPDQKVERIEEMIAEKSGKDTLAFAGDGINDAPVLARADVGIAMGALGSDAAIEAADVVLMNDDPLSIASAIRIARRTLSIVRQNIVLAIGIKLLCLLLCATGLAGMWLAVFGDVGVMILAVLNAMRALFVKKTRVLPQE